MNCIPHMKRPMARNCTTCGGPICIECAKNYDNRCIECCKKDIAAYRKSFSSPMLYLAASAAFMIFVTVLTILAHGFPPLRAMPKFILEVLMLTIGFACFPYGWRGLSRITAGFFLFLPFIGWVIYFVVKGCLAFMSGWMFAAYQLIPDILKKKSMDAWEQFILQDEKAE